MKLYNSSVPLLALVFVISCVSISNVSASNSMKFPSLSNDVEREQFRQTNNEWIDLGAPKGLPPRPNATTKWFEQKLDHFNFATEPQTWQQRYLINDDYWNGDYPNGCPGPILFYTGNESPVTDYWDNSGFMTQVLAPSFNGLLIMMEHRYFGQSQPFPDDPWGYGKVNYLTPEQALADYAYFLTELKDNIMPSAKNCPVYAFGGSYGGMLTAWFRLKYPHIIAGGLAASAPFGFLGTGISPYTFMDTTQFTYATAGKDCDTNLQSALISFEKATDSSDGLAQISEAFKLCKPLQSKDEGLAVLAWIQEGLVDMAMLDYPYSTNYGVLFPAWPVNTTCEKLASGNPSQDPIGALANAMQVFFNTSGTVTCTDIKKDVPDWDVCCGWNYLACTELYIPNAQRGMWWPHTAWNLTQDISACKQEFNVIMRPYWTKTQFAGFDFSGTSNIIFSNGLCDPWHTSGILHDLSPTLRAIVIPEAAHHLDLRGPNVDDPIYVTQAREVEYSIIEQWIWEYFKDYKRDL